MMRLPTVLIALSLLTTNLYAQPDVEPLRVEAKPTRISLFKNGYGLITSRANIPSTGTFVISPLPKATMGTFWVRWPGGVKLDRIVSAYENTTERVVATNLPQMLEANIGNEAELIVAWGKEPARLRGVIRDIPFLPESETNQRGSLLLLQINDKETASIPISFIQGALIVGNGAMTQTEVTKRKPSLRFDATIAADVAAKVEIDTLSQGIAWAPSYAVDITGEGKEATFSAKAVIVNDLMDMESVSAELIAGFPHLQFATIPSAMSLTPLDQLLNQLRNGESAESADWRGRRLVVANQMASFDYPASSIPSMPSTPVMGEQSEDLYFYRVRDVTLAKGERGYYPLFQAKVPFEHRYTWDIPSYIDVYDNYRQPDPQQQQEIVWHVLKLTNTTDRPWTTAPASTTKGGRLLGQDTLRYTPPGQSTDLRITQALNVRAEQNEYEIEREREAARYYGRRYDLVTFRGELAVVNHTDRSITLKITKLITGELQKADNEPEAVKLGAALRAVNPQTRLTWTIDIEPGEENGQKLEYTFQAYVPN